METLRPSSSESLAFASAESDRNVVPSAIVICTGGTSPSDGSRRYKAVQCNSAGSLRALRISPAFSSRIAHPRSPRIPSAPTFARCRRSPAIDFTGYRQIPLTVPIACIETPTSLDTTRRQLSRTVRAHVLHLVGAIGAKGALKRTALRRRGRRQRLTALLARVFHGGHLLEQRRILLLTLGAGEQGRTRLHVAFARRERLI